MPALARMAPTAAVCSSAEKAGLSPAARDRRWRRRGNRRPQGLADLGDLAGFRCKLEEGRRIAAGDAGHDRTRTGVSSAKAHLLVTRLWRASGLPQGKSSPGVVRGQTGGALGRLSPVGEFEGRLAGMGLLRNPAKGARTSDISTSGGATAGGLTPVGRRLGPEARRRDPFRLAQRQNADERHAPRLFQADPQLLRILLRSLLRVQLTELEGLASRMLRDRRVAALSVSASSTRRSTTARQRTGMVPGLQSQPHRSLGEIIGTGRPEERRIGERRGEERPPGRARAASAERVGLACGIAGGDAGRRHPWREQDRAEVHDPRHSEGLLRRKGRKRSSAPSPGDGRTRPAGGCAGTHEQPSLRIAGSRPASIAAPAALSAVS